MFFRFSFLPPLLNVKNLVADISIETTETQKLSLDSFLHNV